MIQKISKLISSHLNSHKELIQNFFYKGSHLIFKEGIFFLIFIISAFFLSPYLFGVFNYVLAVIFLLVILVNFGISQSSSTLTAKFNNTNRKDEISYVFFNSLLLILILAIIIFLIMILFGSFIFNEEYINFIIFALPLIFLIPTLSVIEGIYSGQKKFKQLSIITIGVGMLTSFLIFVLVAMFDIIGAIISYILFVGLLSLVLILKSGKKNFILKKPILKEIGSYSLILGFGGVAFYLFSKVDFIFLEVFGFIEEIGYYAIVIKVINLLILPFVVFGTIIAPNINKLYHNLEFDKLRDLFKMYIFFGFLVSIVLIIIAYITIPFLIFNFLPQYYTDELILMLNLLLPLLIIKSVGAGIVTIGFTVPTGYAKVNLYILIICSLLNLILNYIFLVMFGFIGVIYSTIIVWTISNISLISVFYYIISYSKDFKKRNQLENKY